MNLFWLNLTPSRAPGGWVVAAILVSLALSSSPTRGEVFTFNFTANDGGYGNTGTGSFSYDSSMLGFPISPTFTTYGASGFAPITINFTSTVGSFFVSDAFGSIEVWNDNPSFKDRVNINADTRVAANTYLNQISFKNLASGAYGSTALPLSYSVAQFPDLPLFTYWDASVGHYRNFVIDSVAAVPEPSTYAMALAGIACGGFSMWRQRKRA